MAEHAQSNVEDDYEPEPEEIVPEKPRYSKVIVATCLVLVLAFTVTCLVFIWYGKPLNDTLTAFFFACFGVEFASLAFVTRGKLKYSGGNGVNKQVGHIETGDDNG